MPFEEIPHTADWAIRVRGRDLAELFVNAARGMYNLMADTANVQETVSLAVEVEAATIEGLLVAWLNELLYLTEREGVVFNCFRVISLEAPESGAGTKGGGVGGADAPLGGSDKPYTGQHKIEPPAPPEPVSRLCADVGGGPAGGPPTKYIKAATYHDLRVRQEGSLWVAEVVFDV